MWYCVVSFFKVYKYHIGWLLHNPSALYDLHNTSHLCDTFLPMSEAGLSPAEQPT